MNSHYTILSKKKLFPLLSFFKKGVNTGTDNLIYAATNLGRMFVRLSQNVSFLSVCVSQRSYNETVANEIYHLPGLPIASKQKLRTACERDGIKDSIMNSVSL